MISIILGAALGATQATPVSADQTQTAATPPPAAVQVAAAPMAASSDAPKVAYVRHINKPPFNAVSNGSALLGIPGAIAALSAGEEIVERYQIDDPANRVAETLARNFARSRGAALIEVPVNTGETLNMHQLADPKVARYLIKATTFDWGYRYFPFDWAHYGVNYGADFVILDTVTDQPVARARCMISSEKRRDSPTHRQLTDDNAAALKRLVNEATDACIAKLQAKVPEVR